MSDENKPAATGGDAKIASPRVPSISLEKAIGFMRKMWEHEKRNAAPIPSVLSHWNYKPKSSGGFLAVAAMKRFGLVDEQGSNEKRTLKLSPLALELLKLDSTDPSEFRRLLKKAALAPAFHKEMWSKYGEELPSEATFKSFLVFDKHFSDEAAQQFIRQYKDTITFAKLGSSDMVEETADAENEAKIEPEQNGEQALANSENPSPVVRPIEPPRTPAKHENALPPMTANLRYLPIPLDIGDAPIPVGMSEDDFDLLLDTLKLWKKKIVVQPRRAVWHTDDGDKPIVVVKYLREKKLFLTVEGDTVPENSVSYVGSSLTE